MKKYTDAEIAAKYDEISSWSIMALRGAARRAEVSYFNDLKSRDDLVYAIMDHVYGEDWYDALMRTEGVRH